MEVTTVPDCIVAGLDGSRESLAAADWAAREARRRGLPLRLVHAWEGLTPPGADPDLPELAVPRRWAHQILSEAADEVTQRYPDVRLTCEQVGSVPTEAMREAAEHAELLVLGSRGLGGVAGVLVGSVALATVAHARRPVVLIRAGETAEDERLPAGAGQLGTDTPYREVLLALDPDSACDAPVEFAFDAAVRRRAPLHVLHVWSPPAGYGDLPATAYALEIDSELEARARRAVAAVLHPWRDKLPEQPVLETVTMGRAANSVPAAARRAGLVVVGRRIRHSAVGAHIGPVTHAVIHRVRCPVAVVPHE
ncbi:universal stress protein [Streptomyces sp. CA-132043]|uniref:universal stress protein n=1 Tax=Streptomyces sp. CA-132043 TaxID=3240048 RepID=UPI003D8C1E6A